MKHHKTVLISTLPIEYGKGVATHTRHVVDFLRRQGYCVTLAYYQPYSLAPSLSVPSWELGRRTPERRVRIVDWDVPVHEIGCWLPELEFTNYWLTREWKKVIDAHQYLLAVSGNALAALPFAASGRPYLAWLGTPFAPDRDARVKRFPIARRLLDRFINTPACQHFERVVLNSGLILPTTSYVAREFRRLAPRVRLLEPIPVPVDTSFFTPGSAAAENFTVGFAGKYNDPRKNIHFLLEVITECLDRGVDTTLNLYGDEPSAPVREHIRNLGLDGVVRGLRKASAEELRALYRASGVFVIPSLQEGLCVAGLEAMACGCPVVTSACGGPEEYVGDGNNGFIVPLEKKAFANAICRILCSKNEQSRLAREAERTVSRRFARDVVERSFLEVFQQFTSARGHPAM